MHPPYPPAARNAVQRFFWCVGFGFVLCSLGLSIIVFKIAFATLGNRIPHALSRNLARWRFVGGLECFEYYYTQNIIWSLLGSDALERAPAM